MQKKKHTGVLEALLLVVLIVCILPSSGIKTVMSNEACVCRQTTYAWPEDWDEYWPDEADVSNDVVYYIFQLFNSLNYEWKLFNADPYVSASSIYSVTDSMDDYTYATVFQYMHGSNYTESGWLVYGEPEIEVFVEHYQSFAGNPYIYDHQLYSYTGNGHHYFAFIWTCASAKEIGYYDEDIDYGNGWTYEGTGPVGWAYAWTRQDENDLNEDGFGDPDSTDYCFIGFETYSPPLSNVTGYNDKILGDFVEAFYDQALNTGNRQTINDALDYASQQAYGVDFENTPLYGDGWDAWVPPPANETWHTSMRVFGNGDNYVSIG
jgi:hypothetical protein